MKPASFFGGSLRASAPLWVWAAHFAFCYVAVAIGCDAGWDVSTLRLTLAAGSGVAIAAAALSTVSVWRNARRAAHRGLAARVGLLAATLALPGIAWTALPVLLLPACRYA